MPRVWKTIVRFALVGLAVAALAYVDALFYDATKPANGFQLALTVASMILCPPQLIFATCIDCEVVGREGFVMYSIIGVLNMGFYALVGLLIAFARKARNKLE